MSVHVTHSEHTSGELKRTRIGDCKNRQIRSELHRDSRMRCGVLRADSEFRGGWVRPQTQNRRSIFRPERTPAISSPAANQHHHRPHMTAPDVPFSLPEAANSFAPVSSAAMI